MRSLRSRRANRAALSVLAAIVAACDFPSSPPIFQQTWVVPADSIEVGVSQILPAGISVQAGGAAFVVSMPTPSSFSTTLGALCGQPACQSGVAVAAPVPAFTSSGALLTQTVNFPASVASATLTGGTLNLQVTNNLGFDPLRPNGASAPYGTIAVTFTTGAGSSTVNIGGATQALPTGAATTLNVAVPAGVYGGAFGVSLALDVPAGGVATMASTNSFAIAPSVSAVSVSQATVVVAGDSITTAPTEFDLDDIDFDDIVEGGGILVDVVNPFTASANVSLRIAAPEQGGSGAVSYDKALVIPATPTSSSTITLSKSELQSLVGKSNVTITVRGTATGSGASNHVTVTPAQVIKLRTNVQVILNVGG